MGNALSDMGGEMTLFYWVKLNLRNGKDLETGNFSKRVVFKSKVEFAS